MGLHPFDVPFLVLVAAIFEDDGSLPPHTAWPSDGPALRGPGQGPGERTARSGGRATQAEVGSRHAELPFCGESSAHQLNIT